MKEIKITLAFDNEELGENWLNEDNLKSLLYTTTKTKEHLLIVSEFDTADAEYQRGIIKAKNICEGHIDKTYDYEPYDRGWNSAMAKIKCDLELEILKSQSKLKESEE